MYCIVVWSIYHTEAVWSIYHTETVWSIYKMWFGGHTENNVHIHVTRDGYKFGYKLYYYTLHRWIYGLKSMAQMCQCQRDLHEIMADIAVGACLHHTCVGAGLPLSPQPLTIVTHQVHVGSAFADGIIVLAASLLILLFTSSAIPDKKIRRSNNN